LLDAAGMSDATIVVSGDLHERVIAELVALPGAGEYPVVPSERLARLAAELGIGDPAVLARPLAQHGET
jgi:hypothetical protein